MHAKTDSDVTSIAASSPTHSPPRRLVYFVQSPSRESHDGEKTTSFHSTPALSPMASPPHYHSRESSTRFSETLKPGSNGPRKASSNDVVQGAFEKRPQPWPEYDVIKEEQFVEDEEGPKTFRRRCYLLAFILGFFVLFSLFSVILWGAARRQKPNISVKSIEFERFVISAGSDGTGVATEMASVNSTLKFLYRNMATFFSVHVTATPIDLSYYKITIATGNLKKFYQSRKSQRTVNVQIIGDKIPLYGSGAGFSPSEPVNMMLSFTVRSRAYVLGRLVKPKFYKSIQCAISMEPKKFNSQISLKKACSYQ